MSNLTHQVITKDYPENLFGGIMICGINFGYSVEDESLEKSGVIAAQEPLSFFSDKAVNNTRFKNRVLAWLSSWGFEFVTESGKEGAFEHAFFQTGQQRMKLRLITLSLATHIKTHISSDLTERIVTMYSTAISLTT